MMCSNTQTDGPARTGITSIGDILRTQRLLRGLNVKQIAAETKIGQYYIEAIENGRFNRLPGGVYRRSFLRQYARALGLDENAIVGLFCQDYEQPENSPAPPHRDRPHWHGSIICVPALVLAFVGFYRIGENDWRVLLQTAAPTSVAPRASYAASHPVPPVDAIVSPLKSAEAGRAVRVAFTPTEPVWVSVKSDGLPVYSGTLDGPQPHLFDATVKMTTLVGNAGGLLVSLNGRSIGPLGSHGEVQLLEFTAERARVVTRRPAPTDPVHDKDTQP